MNRGPCTPYVGLFFWLSRGNVCRAAIQNESPVTIAAVDIAFFVNLEPHKRMTEGCAARNIGGTIASVAFLGCSDNFRSVNHVEAISNGSSVAQSCKYQK
jgi:hypothetical protein